jgi:hypothetical protein
MSNMESRRNTSTTSQSLSFVMEIGTDRLEFSDVAILCTCGSKVS